MSSASSFTDVANLNVPGLFEFSFTLEKECIDSTWKNVKAMLAKLSEPGAAVDIQLQGAIIDQIKSAGATSIFSEEFLSQYSSELGPLAIAGASEVFKKATGQSLEDYTQEVLDQVYKYISIVFKMNNGFVYILMKSVVSNAISQLDEKIAKEEEINIYLTALHNVAQQLALGDPVYNKYLDNIRQAYSMIKTAEGKLKIVRGTMSSRDIWLSRPFGEARELYAEARVRLRPFAPTNPYSRPLYDAATKPSVSASDALKLTSGRMLSAAEIPSRVPTKADMDEAKRRADKLKVDPSSLKPEEYDLVENLTLIPILSDKIRKAMRDYEVLTLSINKMLYAFKSGVEAIASALYDITKKQSLDAIDSAIKMSEGVRGSIDSTIGAGKKPNPTNVTALSFKWSTDLSGIISVLALLPEKSLKDTSTQLRDKRFYQGLVDRIKALGKITSGAAVLEAKEGEEQMLNYQRQMLTGLLLVNSMILTPKAGSKALPLVRTLVARNNLALGRDKEIRGILQEYMNHQFDGGKELELALKSINRMLGSAGLDRAVMLLRTGDWEKAFGLNPTTATFIGAGLASLAWLKRCFDKTNDTGKAEALDQVRAKLEKQKALLDLKVSFEFDKIISDNIKLCKMNLSLKKKFDLEAFLCDAIMSAAGEEVKGVSKVGNKMDSLTNIPTGLPI